MLTVSRAVQIQYSPLVMLKAPVLTGLHLSNKVTVYLSDHRGRVRKVGCTDQMTLKNAPGFDCYRVMV